MTGGPGDAYGGVADTCAALRTEAARLEELRLTAVEELWAAQVALGNHGRAVAELEHLVDAHPLRERLWTLLALALYRSARQGDALATLRRARRRLAEEVGLDPGVELRRLEEAVLRQDPGLGVAPSAAVDGRPGTEPVTPRAAAHNAAPVEVRMCVRRDRPRIMSSSRTAGVLGGLAGRLVMSRAERDSA